MRRVKVNIRGGGGGGGGIGTVPGEAGEVLSEITG